MCVCIYIYMYVSGVPQDLVFVSYNYFVMQHVIFSCCTVAHKRLSFLVALQPDWAVETQN